MKKVRRALKNSTPKWKVWSLRMLKNGRKLKGLR